ncbi:MAG TPA: transglycosylase domain-containing protein, partial [Chondromyces sp.]|nr:transglycosylase domain-containing protein [Chondromyces sp.]
MEINTTIKRGRAVKWIRACFFISLLGFALFSIGIGSILIYAKVLGTPPLAVPQSTLYFADDGTVIGENHSGEKRYWVDLDNISPFLVNGTLAIEDKNFFEHNGFDYKRIAGAALADLKAMAKVQGASTISQQYARNLFLSHDKTWKRKLSEALYTIRLEMNYSKEEILEGYLNTIYYGHGAYGIQAASQYYFGKNASDLTLAEASMLAGIPKGPGIYSPIASLEKAKMRQKLILNEMKDSGFITEEQVRQAQAQELRIVGEHVHNGSELAPYFRDTVNHILKTELGLDDRTIDLGGLRVYTTLNTEHQKIAERIVEETIAPESSVQLGFVSMDPDTNFVTALIGGRDYAKSPFNRATQAVR